MTGLAWRKAKSAGMTLLMAAFTLAVLIPLVLIFVHIVKMGISSINLDFFTRIPKPPGETGGGMANGLAGSTLLILLASFLGIPTGIFGAIYLSEYGGGRFANIIRFSADVLSGIGPAARHRGELIEGVDTPHAAGRTGCSAAAAPAASEAAGCRGITVEVNVVRAAKHDLAHRIDGHAAAIKLFAHSPQQRREIHEVARIGAYRA